jgi:hypothetical protein
MEEWIAGLQQTFRGNYGTQWQSRQSTRINAMIASITSLCRWFYWQLSVAPA